MSERFPQMDWPRAYTGAADLWDNQTAGLLFQQDYVDPVWYGRFGDETVYTDTLPSGDNRASVKQYALAQESTITSITVGFTAATTAGTSMRGVIYADNGSGLPGNIVAVGAITVVPAGGGLIVSAVANVLLPAGLYWIGAVCNSFTAFHAHSTAGTGTGINSQMADGTTHNANFLSPVNWPGSSADYDYDITAYADYYVGVVELGDIEGASTITLQDSTVAATATISSGGGGSSGIVGDDTIGTDSFPASYNRAILSDFLMPDDGDLVMGYLRFDATSTAGSNAKFLVYADNGSGLPGSLLYASAEVAVPAGASTQSFVLDVPGLTNGQRIHIGSVADGFQCRWQTDASGGLSRMEGMNYTTPNATWTESGTGTAQINAWADWENAGGGSGVNGAATITLQDSTVSITADLLIEGASTITLQDSTVASTADLLIEAASTITLDNSTVAATADLLIEGASTITLQDSTVAATGVLVSLGSGVVNITLQDSTVSSTADLLLQATSTIQLANSTVAATADLLIAAASTIQLQNATVAATAVGGRNAASIIVLQDSTVSSTADLLLKGSSTIQLQNATVAATAVLVGQGSGSATIVLQDSTVAAVGSLIVSGGSTITLQNSTVAATADLLVQGVSTIQLQNATVAATAVGGRNALTAIQLQDSIVTATGELEALTISPQAISMTVAARVSTLTIGQRVRTLTVPASPNAFTIPER